MVLQENCLFGTPNIDTLIMLPLVWMTHETICVYEMWVQWQICKHPICFGLLVLWCFIWFSCASFVYFNKPKMAGESIYPY
jgi:hypothetical protein